MNRIPIRAFPKGPIIGFLVGDVFEQNCPGTAVFRDQVGKGMNEFVHFQLRQLNCRTWRITWKNTKQVHEFPFAKVGTYPLTEVPNLGEKQYFVPLKDMVERRPVLQTKFI